MKILTQNGFSNFDGFISQGIKPVLKLELENGQYIEATEDHKFLLKDTSWIELKDLTTHHILYNDLKIKSITNQNKSIEVYDALNVTDGHRFNANGIIISNCSLLYIDECLNKCSLITVRNKKTGKIEVLPIEEFYNKI